MRRGADIDGVDSANSRDVELVSRFHQWLDHDVVVDLLQDWNDVFYLFAVSNPQSGVLEVF